MIDEYKDLMEEKFKNVHDTIERNYKEQKEDRTRDTKEVLFKIDEVLDSVDKLKKEVCVNKKSVATVASETSGWRALQSFFKKQPKTFFILIVFLWYILSQPGVKSFLFNWIPSAQKVEIINK